MLDMFHVESNSNLRVAGVDSHDRIRVRSVRFHIRPDIVQIILPIRVDVKTSRTLKIGGVGSSLHQPIGRKEQQGACTERWPLHDFKNRKKFTKTSYLKCAVSTSLTRVLEPSANNGVLNGHCIQNNGLPPLRVPDDGQSSLVLKEASVGISPSPRDGIVDTKGGHWQKVHFIRRH